MTRPDDFEVFWGEMSPCEHFVQMYDEDSTLLDALEGFIAGALRTDESAIVIATPAHLASLNHRLRAQDLDLEALMAQDRYITADAEHTLRLFMRNGWPDDKHFMEVVHRLLGRAKVNGRRIRAFGEMVALLWAQGHTAATVHLEHLWHGLCEENAFSLFCAYPKSGFTKDASESMQEICDAHSKVVCVG
jgi:hypothetical protein